MQIRLFDVNSATALSQILPIILLGVLVELRRTKLHTRGRNARRTRALTGVFFMAFAVIETILVLSIDGKIYPFELSDLFVALVIFAMLWLLFFMSLMPDRRRRDPGDDAGDTHDDSDDDDL